MRAILAVFVLLVPGSLLGTELSGTWEGFGDRGSMFGSHILDISEDGQGFYAYTLGETPVDAFVFQVDIAQMGISDGMLVLEGESGEVRHKLVLAQDIGPRLSALTITILGDNEATFSTSWGLVKVRGEDGEPRDQRLYEFALDEMGRRGED